MLFEVIDKYISKYVISSSISNEKLNEKRMNILLLKIEFKFAI